MNALAVLQLLVLAALAFLIVSGALASYGLSWGLAATAAWAPERRHRALLLLSVAPMLLGLFALLAVLAPSLLAMAWPEYDHCLTHRDGHVHLCFLHPPPHLGNALSLVIFGLASGWVVLRVAGTLLEVHRVARCARRLRLQGGYDLALGANVLPTVAPVCALIGVLWPTLFLSTGLLSQMGADEIPVILHHERAHAARRDVLLRLVARAGSTFMWPRARLRLLAALELAAEQSCDEIAASVVGDRVEVAAVILKVERLFQGADEQLGSLAIAFGSNGVPERVLSLLGARRSRGNFSGMFAGLTLVLCGLLVASSQVHHLTETILGALTH